MSGLMEYLNKLSDDSRCDHQHHVRRFGSDAGLRMHGCIRIGESVSIAEILDMNAKDSYIEIGEGCDIAAGVTITCADSHERCLDPTKPIERLPVKIGNRVFIGQGAIILGGCDIGDGCVIGAGVVLPKNTHLPSGTKVVAPGFRIISEEAK